MNRRQSLGEGGLADLEATREDVVQEVLNTPRRREDNDITRLTEKMHLLQVSPLLWGLLSPLTPPCALISCSQMHCKIIDDVLERYHSKLWRFRIAVVCALSGSIGAVAGAAMVEEASSLFSLCEI